MNKTRALWSEELLQKAMRAIAEGMPVRTAATRYKIPRRTLRNHQASGKTTKQLGRPSYLTPAQEMDLCNRIFRLAEVGMPITGKVIQRSVYTFCSQNNVKNPFDTQSGLAGRKWLRLFLQRHPEVAQRKAQNMNPGRAAKLNRFIVGDYFSKLKATITRLSIFDKPQLIYNADEKGCRLGIHKQQTVYAKKGQKRVHFIAPEHGENVSIISCGNALGQVIPPMILFKGKRLNPEWKENLPPGTDVKMTQKGSMTTATFIEWIHHFAKFKPPGNVLLIFDGASSHLDAGIVEAAEMYNITLFCLPSNTTHELQPMDKSVFGPYETFWDDEVLLYWSKLKPTDPRTISKGTFGRIFSKVWPRSATPVNVSAGFRATGIYPFDRNAIPESAFTPSELTRHVTAETPALTHEPQPVPTLARKKVAGQLLSDDARSTSDDFSVSDEPTDAEQLQTSFKDTIPTPEMRAKNGRNRRKAINYRAVEVTTELFCDDQKDVYAKNETSVMVTKVQKRKYTMPSREDQLGAGPSDTQEVKTDSWYCSLCKEDRVADMRLCTKCSKYVHEECVGLTVKDKISAFLCPECDL